MERIKCEACGRDGDVLCAVQRNDKSFCSKECMAMYVLDHGLDRIAVALEQIAERMK